MRKRIGSEGRRGWEIKNFSVPGALNCGGNSISSSISSFSSSIIGSDGGTIMPFIGIRAVVCGSFFIFIDIILMGTLPDWRMRILIKLLKIKFFAG